MLDFVRDIHVLTRKDVIYGSWFQNVALSGKKEMWWPSNRYIVLGGDVNQF